MRESDTLSNVISNTELLLDQLNGSEPMMEFAENIFKGTIQNLIVFPDKIVFRLINGINLEERR